METFRFRLFFGFIVLLVLLCVVLVTLLLAGFEGAAETFLWTGVLVSLLFMAFAGFFGK